MPKAVLLHGTDGSPDYNWFPWLKKELEKRSYEVWVPLLPDNHTPSLEKYDTFLHESGWDFTDNIIIGHSSGATTILNLLETEWFPKIEKAILVGTFLNERLLPGVDWYEDGQFNDLFPRGGFDENELKRKSNSFIFIHGDNDPYCDIGDAKEFSQHSGGEIVIVKDGLHLSSNRKELPEILPFIEVR